MGVNLAYIQDFITCIQGLDELNLVALVVVLVEVKL